jgi:hypothetical protein
MKLKLLLHITDTLKFSRGEYDGCFGLYTHNNDSIDGWMCCGEVEFDVDIDSGEVAAKAVADIEKEEERIKLAYTEKMAFLEQSKQELLCIGSDSE